MIQMKRSYPDIHWKRQEDNVSVLQAQVTQETGPEVGVSVAKSAKGAFGPLKSVKTRLGYWTRKRGYGVYFLALVFVLGLFPLCSQHSCSLSVHS
jgi:hypothetical protein